MCHVSLAFHCIHGWGNKTKGNGDGKNGVKFSEEGRERKLPGKRRDLRVKAGESEVRVLREE